MIIFWNVFFLLEYFTTVFSKMRMNTIGFRSFLYYNIYGPQTFLLSLSTDRTLVSMNNCANLIDIILQIARQPDNSRSFDINMYFMHNYHTERAQTVN